MQTVQFRAANVSKRFGGSKALEKAELRVLAGEVHGLVGENGAGKSTLVKIIAGAIRKDEGELWLQGDAYEPHGPRDAYRHGVAVVHQHLSLVPGLSVTDNMFLGRYETQYLGFVKRRTAEDQAIALLRRLGSGSIRPSTLVRDLTTPQRYLVEIAKTLLGQPRLIVLDEPTASLGDRETKALFETVREVVQGDRSVIWITHRLEELDRIASRITIMRDGRTVEVCEKNGVFDRDRIITSMTGRVDLVGSIKQEKREEKRRPAENAIEFARVSTEGGITDLSFEVKQGEIVAVSGLVGCGMEKISRIFCGRERLLDGSIKIGERLITSSIKPSASARLGVYHLPANRTEEGIFPKLTVEQNMTISALGGLSSIGGFVKRHAVRRRVNDNISSLNIRPRNAHTKMGALSGGNQQKVIFARGMLNRPTVAILEGPTQGVDVGAKHEIYSLMEMWCELGTAILIISTDTREVITVPDRVLSMYKGRIVAEFVRNDINEESLIRSYFGVEQS